MQTVTKPRNIKELRDSLLDNYQNTKEKRMPINMCKELANTAGKVINTIQAELMEKQLMKSTEPIGFLHYPQDVTMIENNHEHKPYVFDKGLPNFKPAS